MMQDIITDMPELLNPLRVASNIPTNTLPLLLLMMDIDIRFVELLVLLYPFLEAAIITNLVVLLQ